MGRPLMPDDYDQLEELTNKLLASSALLKAWQSSLAIENSYAWHLLNHSWLLKPEVSQNHVPHNPQLQIWDSASGWTDNNPYVLTVFRSVNEHCLCRYAIWHCRNFGETKQRLVDFINHNGQVTNSPPNITVTDTVVASSSLMQHLHSIAAVNVPAISVGVQDDHFVTSDIGSVGFEFFSESQPPATVRYKWSDYTPPEWKPLICEIDKLRQFLLNCFE